MTSLPPFLRPDAAPAPTRSLFQILGSLGPVPDPETDHAAPFRVACVLEAARRGRPTGPPRPTPPGAAPPAA